GGVAARAGCDGPVRRDRDGLRAHRRRRGCSKGWGNRRDGSIDDVAATTKAGGGETGGGEPPCSGQGAGETRAGGATAGEKGQRVREQRSGASARDGRTGILVSQLNTRAHHFRGPLGRRGHPVGE